MPPGSYRLISGTVEKRIDVASGDKLTVEVTRTASPAPEVHDMSIREPIGPNTAPGSTRSALELLPRSGSVYGLIERSDPLVVTELIEGGGTYLDPQRLGASGASWTQTSFRLGDADVTDPDRTGFAMFYPNLDTLQAVSVTTAGLPPDGYGGGTSVMLVPRMPASTWQRTFRVRRLAAGVSIGESSPGGPVHRTAAGGECRLVCGQRAPVRAPGHPAGRRHRPVDPHRAGCGVAVDSRARTLTSHLAYKATPRDDVRLFAQFDGLSFPAVGRAALVDPGLEQRTGRRCCRPRGIARRASASCGRRI